jgi:murein hydrolase activator
MKLNKLLIFLLFLTCASTVFGQNSNELKRKKEALQRDIEQLQKNLSKTVSGKKLTLAQINGLKTQIRLRQEKISTINSEMKTLDNQITENTGKVHNLQNRLSDLKKEYAGMMRFAQRNKNAYDKMMFIFASTDFNQAYKRVKYLQQFGQYRKKQAGYIQGTEKDLAQKIVILDKTLKSKTSLLKEQQAEKSKLDKNKNEQAVVLNQFSKQEKQYNQDIQKRKQQQNAIDREIRNAIQREIAAARKKEEEAERARIAKAKAENKPITASKAKTNDDYFKPTPEAAKLSAAFENNRGSLPYPVANGIITERFGEHTFQQASYNNDGVTIQTSEGTAVRSVFNGEVSTVKSIVGTFFVIIKHGDYMTVYQNLKSVSVAVGDKVSTKQNIGIIGKEGDVFELKFQIHRLVQMGKDRKPVKQNPEAWISK